MTSSKITAKWQHHNKMATRRPVLVARRPVVWVARRPVVWVARRPVLVARWPGLKARRPVVWVARRTYGAGPQQCFLALRVGRTRRQIYDYGMPAMPELPTRPSLKVGKNGAAISNLHHRVLLHNLVFYFLVLQFLIHFLPMFLLCSAIHSPGGSLRTNKIGIAVRFSLKTTTRND